MLKKIKIKRREITEKNEFFLKKEKTRRKLKNKTERNVEQIERFEPRIQRH